MALQPESLGPVPEETARVVCAALPKGHPYGRWRDELGLFYSDARFAHLFAVRGQPAEVPWRRALVRVLQFAETLSDRQAAEAVRTRLDWTDLLGLELTDQGFTFSILSAFRSRLITDDAAYLLRDAVLERCGERARIKARGRQRTDAPHVLGAIGVLKRLAGVGEALRHALKRLAVVAPTWFHTIVPAEWGERYVPRLERYRLPATQTAQQAVAATIGRDGCTLLPPLFHPTAPAALRTLEAGEVLRQIWVQPFVVRGGHLRGRKEDDLPPPAQRIHAPYDPQARQGAKRTTEWIGDKVHLTETCDEETPHLVTQVATTAAACHDHKALPAIQTDLAQRALPPAAPLVDAGQTEAEPLATSPQHEIARSGPAPQAHDWQTRAGQGSDHTHVHIDWTAAQVICPHGRRSVGWQPRLDRPGHSILRVTFAKADSLACPARRHCTRAATAPRALGILPHDQYEVLAAARAYQRTPAFKERYAARAGSEGTLSQRVRVCDLRRTRYVGHARTHLQPILSAVALNVVRLAAWFAGTPRATTRPSPFAKLFLAAA